MNYILDTNIIIIYSRDNQIAREIEKRYSIFNGEGDLYISIVTLGELDSFIKQNNIGDRKVNKILRLLDSINKVDIHYGEIISLHGDIDEFSQGKVGRADFSSKNMGKNDLWIAATASHYNLKLITTDKDFLHLENEFLDLEFIDVEKMKSKDKK